MSKGNNHKSEAKEEQNPFKLINNVDELPPKLKDEVMATINSALLVADVGKLFSIDMGRTAAKMVDPAPNNSNK